MCVVHSGGVATKALTLPAVPSQVFKDNCCKREILALQIHCRNDGRGCAEQLALGQLLVSTRASWSVRPQTFLF